MNEYECELEVDDIDFADVTETKPPKKSPIEYLPVELRERAKRLPDGEQHTVLELPPADDGHNAGLIKVAGTCYRMGVSFDDTLAHLQVIYDDDRIDFDIAPLRAVERVWEVDGDLSKLVDDDSTSNPKKKEEFLLRFRRMSQDELIEASPGNINTKTGDILKDLFGEEDIINIQYGALESGTLTKRRNLFFLLENKGHSLNEFKFLNPATFKKVEGVPNTKRKDRRITTRCNDNVKDRRYMVLEMDDKDEGKVERFTNFAYTMAAFAPLVMAVETGGKSIHFWFDTKAGNANPKNIKQFFAQACLHGADSRLAVKSQIARMPNVSAEKEGRGRQRVIYYDAAGDNWPKEPWDLSAFEAFLTESKQLDYYYNGNEGEAYYTRDDSGRWYKINRTSMLVELAKKGYRKQIADGEVVTPAEDVLNIIQREKNLSGVVKGCAGRHAGFYEENGERFLVTSSPVMVKPRKAKWDTIDKFLSGLLIDDEQRRLFLGLFSAMVRDAWNGGKRKGGFRQIQKCIFGGPANSGKTLLKDLIITPCMGGRQASAEPYFKQNQDLHNAEMFASEVIYLDDTSVLLSNYQARQEYTERVKTIVVGGGMGGLRSMRQDRLPVRTLNRCFRFMNLEPQTLATLPLLDDGAADKWVIFLTRSLNEYWPECELPGWFYKVAEQIREELPAFQHYLIYEHKIEEEDRCPLGRYPTKSFKNETILGLMAEGSVETYLLHRFDNDCETALFGDAFENDAPLTPWRGSADALHELLASTGSRVAQNRFMKICPNSKVLLSQLRQLEKDTDRVKYSDRCEDIPTKFAGCKYWMLWPKEKFVDDEGFEDLL